jgi:hypothetical protein
MDTFTFIQPFIAHCEGIADDLAVIVQRFRSDHAVTVQRFRSDSAAIVQ